MNPTRPLPDPSHPHLKSGSTLVVVLMIMLIVSFSAASLLNLGTHEKNLTFRRVTDIEARHVAESALELAIADLEVKFEAMQSLTGTPPVLELSDRQKELLLDHARHVQDVRILEVRNQLLRQRVYIHENDQSTLLDPHRGTYINVSEWDVIAEVDVQYRGQTRQIRAAQTFQVRETPLFTHAIFYNMDLEFHPGPFMEIHGPVHSNSRISLISGNHLYFFDRVSATNGVFAGPLLEGFEESWAGAPPYYSGQTAHNVWFNTNGRQPDRARRSERSGVRFASLHDGTNNQRMGTSYYDSRSVDSDKLFNGLGFSDMSEFLGNWFDGFLVVGADEAPAIRPGFIPPYVPDDGSGNRGNFGYSLIEPVKGVTYHGEVNPFHKGEGEREKYAFKAGLTFEVRYEPDLDPEDAPAHWRRLLRKETNIQVNNANQLDALEEEDFSDYWVVPQRIHRDDTHDLDSTRFAASANRIVRDPEGNPLVDEDGAPITETIREPEVVPVHINEMTFHQLFRARLYEERNNGRPHNNWGGIYDRREKKPMDLVDFNMGHFKEIIERADPRHPSHENVFFHPLDNYRPHEDYNGVVYFQFPLPEVWEPRPDRIVVAQDDFRDVDIALNDFDAAFNTATTTSLSLYVHNASQLPSPRFLNDIHEDFGFTLAANGRVYVKGHYNADGNMNTGSSQERDGIPGDGYDVLAAIAADAITFLSENHQIQFSKQHKDWSSGQQARATEVNAAIMQGIMPTNATDFDARFIPRDGVISGGSHNHHRFLERWFGIDFTYRGSLVAFFESELSRSPMEQADNRYYGAPNRNYGFYEAFGTGAQPPGTPMARTYFKLGFRFL